MTEIAKTPTPPISDRSQWWIEKRGIALIALAVAWFYLWTATSGANRLSFDVGGLDYYNLLVDGFLEGHLSLDYQGDPGIAKLKDPYDPAQNAAYRVLDMSYYKGKYYIYFGPTPALVLLLPWKVVTGFHLPSHLGTVIFCVAGYWVSLGLMLRLRRYYFPGTGPGPVWLATLLLGLANMAPVLLRRPSVYELAISCGYFFLMLALWALHRALTEPLHRVAWLAVGSAAYGLALLARPTYLYGAVIFALVLGWWWRRRDAEEGLGVRGWWRTAIAAALPLGLIFCGMLLYNYLRFENPFEFGQIYQLTARDMGKVKAFSWSYLPFNTWLYWLMPAQLSAYFPFFLNGLPPPMPAGYDGMDNLYGLLPNLPVVVLAAGALLGSRGRTLAAAREFNFFGLLLACGFVAVIGVFLFFSGATIRYYLDFLPVWLLLVCLGMWSIGRALAPRPLWRGVAWVAMGGLAFFSMTFAVMVSFQHAGLLRAVNRNAFNRIARVSNTASYVYDRVAGTRYGPIKVELKFPTDRRGQFEPLIVSGAAPNVDYLWVLYRDEGHVQFGLEHTSRDSATTQPIAVDYNAAHTLEIDAGFLYPPEAHPYFKGGLDEGGQRTRTLRVILDGVPYLDTHAEFYDPVSPRIAFGENHRSDSFGRRFTGQVKNLARIPPQPLFDRTTLRGAFELAVVFPTGRLGKREPLIVTGETGKGDLFYVEYLDARHVRFGLDHWGVGAVISPPLEIAPDYVYVLEVNIGSLATEADAAMKNRLVIRANGTTLLDRETSFHPVPPETQTIGINLIGGSEVGESFTGKILSLKRRNQW